MPELRAMPSISPSVFRADDEPVTWWSSSSRVGRHRDMNVEEVYSESHRLAVEQLISGGVGAYTEFLKKERVQNFLSGDEIEFILKSAAKPESAKPQQGDSGGLVVSDATSLIYFPDTSDVEGPALDIGWSAISPGSYRGVTTAIAHFQPNYTPNIPVECIYSCKNAARKMIKTAKEVIAIVTDCFTDLDIFRDLQEACTRRRVPVYIVLDLDAVPSFLQMCNSLNVCLANLQKMRVRAVTGYRYFTRFGARITGKIHEQFMLTDGTKVAMGTYRFRWTDVKINTCNLTELTGSVIEQYEEEFRRLYKKSLAVNTKAVFSPPTPKASTPTPASPKVVPSLAEALGVKLNSHIPTATVTSSAANPLTSRPTSYSALTQNLNRLTTQGTQTNPTSAHRLVSTSSFEADSSGSESTCSTPTEANPLPLTKAPQSGKPCLTQTSYQLKLPGPGLSNQQQQQQQQKHVSSSSIRGQSNYTTISICSRKDYNWSTPSIMSVVQRGCKVQQNTRPGPGLTVGSILMSSPIRSRYLQ